MALRIWYVLRYNQAMNQRRIGPYRIEAHLGSGGMGAVYKAYDERLGRWVAIKSILPETELSDDRRERLRREARSAAALNHPAISQVHDIIIEDGLDHIVMEYVEGAPLSRLINKAELSIEEAVAITRQIAEGLVAAHSHGVIHRDLKAENIMVTDSGQVKILDFGLAKRIDRESEDESLTKEGTVIGTCRAMSPEQAQGHQLDNRSDIFSLGTLLYTMVTGRHPFAGPTPVETMRRVVYDPVPNADRVNEEVPSQLAILIDRMLAKKPGDRPENARQVAIALAELESLWNERTPSSSVSRLTSQLLKPPPSRRPPGILIAAFTFIIVLLTAGGLWLKWAPDPVVVAVLEPELSPGADALTARLAADGMRVAMLNSIARVRTLAAIDTSEVDSVEGSPLEVAVATAADEALAIEVDDCTMTCQVTVRRISGADGHILASKLISIPPGDLYLLTNMATIVLGQVYPEESIDPEVGAMEVKPEDWDAFIQAWRQIVNPSPGVKRDDLLDRLRQIRSSSPGFLPAHCAEARIARYMYRATSDEAYLLRGQEAVRRARVIAPGDPRPVVLDLDLKLAAGELDEARQLLEELRSIDPTFPGLKTRQADLEMEVGNCAEALALYEQVVAARPSWSNYLDLGAAEEDCGKPTRAVAHLRFGLKLAPGNRYLMTNLAEALVIRGELSEAEQLYNQLAESQPDLHNLINLGTTRMLLGDYSGAVIACERAAAISRKRPYVLLNLADSYLLSGRKDEATAVYEEALAAAQSLGATSSASNAAVIALSSAHLGMKREAAQSIQQALMLAPQDPQCQYDAAVVNELIGQHTSAMAHAEKAIELGLSPVWFQIPWASAVLEDPRFAEILEQNQSAGQG